MRFSSCLRYCLLRGIILLLLPSSVSWAQTNVPGTWAQVQKTGKGILTVYWYESKPFVFRNEKGLMTGIEPDILEGFKHFLKDTYHVDVQMRWKEANSFIDTYGRVLQNDVPGTFSVSAFTITPKRKEEVGFSPTYMSDITVLISSKEIPIVNTIEEFNRVFSKLSAVTIRGTTYEQDLLNIRKNSNIPFGLHYIPSNQNILETIAEMDSAFGFIDLPIYMKSFNNNPLVAVKRQNLFAIKHEGYAIAFPRGSDWSSPLEEYLLSREFKEKLESIVGKYIDVDLYRFVEGYAVQADNPVMLLTKEKEIQQRDIAVKLEQIAMEARRTKFLTALAVVILSFLFTIIVMYRKRNEQKRKIEAQGKSLALKGEQLEKRNQHLVTLDEEKNNLIKILAHDLRTPINHVQGLAQVFLLSNPGLPEDQKALIQNITDAAVRLNKMITHILDIDAIENNRIKVFMDDVGVDSLLQQVIQSFDKSASKKNIHILYKNLAKEAVVKGDSLFLIQIFENLLSNAVKFSPKGTQIEVLVERSGQKLRIKFKDQGPGLTEDDMQHLFKKFQRLSAQPTGGEGSLGLGLSIVKKYTELMGGTVRCESSLQHGATFIIEFDAIS